MQQLPFCPQPNYKVKSQPRRKTFDFGDGYQQRQVDGLNPLQRKYKVSFYLKNKKAVELIAFFESNAGVTAFEFIDKHGQKRKVVCPSWNEDPGLTHTKIEAEFEEVA